MPAMFGGIVISKLHSLVYLSSLCELQGSLNAGVFPPTAIAAEIRVDTNANRPR